MQNSIEKLQIVREALQQLVGSEHETSEDLAAMLVKGSRLKTLYENDLLFEFGDVSNDCLYIVLQGELQVTRDPSKAFAFALGISINAEQDGVALEPPEAILETRTTGAILGEMALLDGSPRMADVKALCDCRLLEISRLQFEEALKRHPAFGFALISNLAKRLRNAWNRMDILRLRTCKQQVAAILLYESVSHNSDAIGITQAELFQKTTFSERQVKTILSKLKKEKLVGRSAMGIQIIDRLPLFKLLK